MLRRLALLAFTVAFVASSFAAANDLNAFWPDGGTHVHSDYQQHAALGFGTQFLSYVSVGQPMGEVDVHKDAAGKTWVLAGLISGGFALIDGTDPANPVLVKTVTGLAAYGADAKMSDDTNTVFMGLQGGGGQGCDLADSPVLPMLPARKATCGIQVFDTTNKANPVFLGSLPTGTGGTHMLDYEVLNGVPTIGMAQTGGSPSGVPLAIMGANKVPVTVGRIESGGTHDVTLTMDPQFPGRALAIVANGGVGVTVWDITAPALPLQLGSWSSGGQYVHTVMLTVIEGKRVIVASEETGGSSQMWFLDASDYANLRLLGTWTNPDRYGGAGYRWSTHNINIADGKLYLSHYHGGVLVFDIDQLSDLANPPIVANFMAAKPRVGSAFGSEIPYSWDAVPFEGVVWVGDINTGVHAFRLA